jgi:hypothetical protein
MKAEDLKKGSLVFSKHHGYAIVIDVSDSFFRGEKITSVKFIFLDGLYRLSNYYREKETLLSYEKIADLEK